MSIDRFVSYQLRTSEVEAARAFYADLLGNEIWGPDVEVAPLPPAAVARGARPHWLGQIGVQDFEGTLGRMVALGAQQLGVTERLADGGRRAAVRDPFGAVLALKSGPAPQSRGLVLWHALNVTDHRQAMAAYAALFGWTALQEVPIEGVGTNQLFGWDGSGQAVGSVADSARRAEVHKHWLFMFRVPDAAAAVARVRAQGGAAKDPVRTPRGDLVAACDDLQGAAFGVYQRG